MASGCQQLCGGQWLSNVVKSCQKLSNSTLSIRDGQWLSKVVKRCQQLLTKVVNIANVDIVDVWWSMFVPPGRSDGMCIPTAVVSRVGLHPMRKPDRGRMVVSMVTAVADALFNSTCNSCATSIMHPHGLAIAP